MPDIDSIAAWGEKTPQRGREHKGQIVDYASQYTSSMIRKLERARYRDAINSFTPHRCEAETSVKPSRRIVGKSSNNGDRMATLDQGLRKFGRFWDRLRRVIL